jgi:Zn-dependent oligopeptidase
MLENWMWDKDVLKRVSKHYKTGDKMPDAMVETMMQIKNMHQASSTLGQIFLGTFDFLFHSANDANLLKAGQSLTQQERSEYNLASYREGMHHEQGYKVDSMALWNQLKKDITGMPEQEGTNPVASFDHIIGGYASTYYGYLWSKVYSSELFSEFEQKGLLNPEVGMKYRKVILSHGGSRDSIDSLREFLGREPNQDAFLYQSGFKERPK